MIKEFALGLNKRHYFQSADNIDQWQGFKRDTFMSLYDYDDYVKDFFGKHNSLSGYDGLLYMPDEFILDVDAVSSEAARQKTIGLILHLDDIDIPSRLFFSGTGFHVYIPSDAFRWKPAKDLHLKVKHILTKSGIFEYADPSVTDKTRLIRVPNTRNTKSNLYKVQISRKLLEGPIGDIETYAKLPRKLDMLELECSPVFDILEKPKEDKVADTNTLSQGRVADPINYPCISGMFEAKALGQRHAVGLRLSAWLRWRYPEFIVRKAMEAWRENANTASSPFKSDEMSKIVDSSYEAHGGEGNRYGCLDPVMDKYCKNTCRLYKAKKSQTTMQASDMERELAEFYAQEYKPLNLGALYGQDFPIYPGEVVILQAPPASMKTMLLQNWMVAFKKITYFIEMEMSPRQVWSRFVQIEKNWTEEQLAKHYKTFQNGIDKDFEWLTVDYSSPFAQELDKRIAMLPRKPEILAVDHLGLFKSNHRDSNMKAEEASQALLEAAVKHNIIVFAVSEISKQAYKEGMDIASSKGSFRIAYNANKVLSLKAWRDPDTGLVKEVTIISDKNREKETLNVRLTINNLRIEKNDSVAHA